MSKSYSFEDYIAWDRLPHMWCAGCGHGITLKGIAAALADLQIPPHKALIASGIGCSGRAGDYVLTVFRTHGRTLAFATGINAAGLNSPLLLGEGTARYQANLFHAAENLNVTVIVGNNSNYGMTGDSIHQLPKNTIMHFRVCNKEQRQYVLSCSQLASLSPKRQSYTIELFS